MTKKPVMSPENYQTPAEFIRSWQQATRGRDPLPFTTVSVEDQFAVQVYTAPCRECIAPRVGRRVVPVMSTTHFYLDKVPFKNYVLALPYSERMATIVRTTGRFLGIPFVELRFDRGELNNCVSEQRVRWAVRGLAFERHIEEFYK